MSGFASVQIEGGRQLDRALRRLPVRLARRHLREAARKGLAPIRTAAREHLRSDYREPTGRLRRSLKIRVVFVRGRGQVLAQLHNSRDTYYGRFLEFGTRYIPGSRWMTRAVAARQADAVAAFGRSLWSRLASDARRARRGL